MPSVVRLSRRDIPTSSPSATIQVSTSRFEISTPLMSCWSVSHGYGVTPFCTPVPIAVGLIPSASVQASSCRA